jgi:hypothetical protein
MNEPNESIPAASPGSRRRGRPKAHALPCRCAPSTRRMTRRCCSDWRSGGCAECRNPASFSGGYRDENRCLRR